MEYFLNFNTYIHKSAYSKLFDLKTTLVVLLCRTFFHILISSIYNCPEVHFYHHQPACLLPSGSQDTHVFNMLIASIDGSLALYKDQVHSHNNSHRKKTGVQP